MSISSVPASPVREIISRDHSSSLTTLSEVDGASKQSAYIEVNKLDSAKRKRYDRMDPRDPELAGIVQNAASTQPRSLEEVCHRWNDVYIITSVGGARSDG